MTLSRRTALALAGAAVTARTTEAAAQADTRPILRVAVQALPPSLDPIESLTAVGQRISDNVFDTLLRRDFAAEQRDGRAVIRPHLATKVEQRDPLTWAATLREGVMFHDGFELTAEDVAASFEEDRLWGAKAPYYQGRAAWGHLDRVTAEDSRTVLFRTKAPDLVMPMRLASFAAGIGSRRAMQAAGVQGWRTRPIGSGPYRIAAFDPDTRVVMDSHDAYFQGRPAARRVIVTAVSEASSRLAGLRAGDFDLVTSLLPDQRSALAQDPHLEAVSVPMDLVHLLYFDTRRPALRDPRVRQALVHAVDTDLITHTLWGASARPLHVLQSPTFGDLYEPNRPGLVYDPDLARRLLAEAGWPAQEIVIRIVAGYWVNMLSAVQIVQEMWRAVGVPSRIEVVESRGTLERPGADVRPTTVTFRFPDPLGGGLLPYFSRQFLIQEQGFWRSDRFNALTDQFTAAVDPGTRRALWHSLLDTFEAEAPALILYPVQEVIAKRRDVRFVQDPQFLMDLRPANFGFL
jgi:peptide/nickel transport system substrate-binding protein